MEVQEAPTESQDGSEGQVMESMGISGEMPQESEVTDETESPSSNETLAVQKRLKSQKRAHEREVRELHARIGDLEARMSQPTTSQDQTVNPYGNPQGNGIDEQIHKAVSYALQHKEMEERKAHEAKQAAYVNRQHQELNRHLDGMNDKYDDFHEVVFSHEAPFTPAMLHYSLTLPKKGSGSAGEVLYQLGKNPDELKRIAELHPLEQASEMARLSHALISGGETKSSSSRPPLGNIKSNPVSNSHAITDKTSVGELRKRMKAGWK